MQTACLDHKKGCSGRDNNSPEQPFFNQNFGWQTGNGGAFHERLFWPEVLRECLVQ